jgi:uncharacterized protein involved in oxidation of intracellular sulfur
MKIGIILETKEYEKAWNAFRFAVTAKKQGHEVKFFLMGEAVECEGLIHDKYNVDEQLKAFVSAGGEILACGTCLKSRQLNETDACPISTMIDCVNLVVWADKVVNF